MFELAAQVDRVRQVAVVPERDLALVAINHQGCALISTLSPAVE